MVKIMVLLFCVASFSLMFAACACAAGYAGHYGSFAYDAEGQGNPVDNADGLPAQYVAHLQLYGDGTYEMLIFGALTVGKWHVMKSQQGNEFVGMSISETVDKGLKELYAPGDPTFMLTRHTTVDNAFKLIQVQADEIVYLEMRDGELDVDAVMDEIQKYLSGEE